jgi:hypothetical protein
MPQDLLPALGTGLTALACSSLALLGIHGLIGPTSPEPGPRRALGLAQLGLALMLTGTPARSYGLVLVVSGMGLAIWSFSRRPTGRSGKGAASCAAC